MGEVHDTTTLVAYLFDELSDEDRREVEVHVKTCSECADFLSFAKDYERLLRKNTGSFERPVGEPCPATDVLVRLHAEELDRTTAEHVRAHLLHCVDCLEEYLVLERIRDKSVGISLRVGGGVVECIPLPEHMEFPAAPLESNVSAGLRVLHDFFEPAGGRHTVALRLEAVIEGVPEPVEDNRAVLFVEVERPRSWMAIVLDRDHRVIAKQTLENGSVELANLAFGLYILELWNQDARLCGFAIQLSAFSAEEYAQCILEKIDIEQYRRAVRLTQSALKRHHGHPSILEALGKLQVALTTEARRRSEQMLNVSDTIEVNELMRYRNLVTELTIEAGLEPVARDRPSTSPIAGRKDEIEEKIKDKTGPRATTRKT